MKSKDFRDYLPKIGTPRWQIKEDQTIEWLVSATDSQKIEWLNQELIYYTDQIKRTEKAVKDLVFDKQLCSMMRDLLNSQKQIKQATETEIEKLLLSTPK